MLTKRLEDQNDTVKADNDLGCPEFPDCGVRSNSLWSDIYRLFAWQQELQLVWYVQHIQRMQGIRFVMAHLWLIRGLFLITAVIYKVYIYIYIYARNIVIQLGLKVVSQTVSA